MTVDAAFKKAVRAYKTGRIEVARNLLSRIIEIEPNHAEANYIMGSLLVRKSEVKNSLVFFKTALEANFSIAKHWFGYIDALIKLASFHEASQLYDIAISKGCKGQAFDRLAQKIEAAKSKLPIQIESLLELIDQGATTEAIHTSKCLLKDFPNSLELSVVLGLAYEKSENFEGALKIYKGIVKLKPDYVEAYYNIGIVLGHQGKQDEAMEAFHMALTLKPEFAEAYSGIGITLRNQDKLNEAIDAFHKALAVKPDFAEAYINIGNTLAQQEKLDEAINAYSKALLIRSDYAEAHYNMGNALKEQNKLDKAIDTYQKALALKPNFAQAYSNMGIALRDQHKLDEAINVHKKAISLQPDSAEFHNNMSIALLTNHQFEEGFLESEWRFKTPKPQVNKPLTSKPLWAGETNQIVFVWAEQGIGDEIMFASLIPELYKKCSKLFVQCDKRLISLYERSFPSDITFLSNGRVITEEMYDYHTPIGSLARVFRASEKSFSNSPNKFLYANNVQVNDLRQKILKGKNRKLVGISWKTNASSENAKSRNIALHELAPALASPETQLVCLQYGDVSREIRELSKSLNIDIMQVHNIDIRDDIDGLASLIQACDRVVSTTNVTVHLAGALGADVQALVPFATRWVWGRLDDFNGWYPSVTPYRQKRADDWNSVLKSIRIN